MVTAITPFGLPFVIHPLAQGGDEHTNQIRHRQPDFGENTANVENTGAENTGIMKGREWGFPQTA